MTRTYHKHIYDFVLQIASENMTFFCFFNHDFLLPTRSSEKELVKHQKTRKLFQDYFEIIEVIFSVILLLKNYIYFV